MKNSWVSFEKWKKEVLPLAENEMRMASFSDYCDWLFEKVMESDSISEYAPDPDTRTLLDTMAFHHAMTRVADQYLDEITDGAYN